MTVTNIREGRTNRSKAELIACLKEFNAVADKVLTELDKIDHIMSTKDMKKAA